MRVIFSTDKKSEGTLQQVELLSDDDAAEREKEKPKEPTPEDKIEEMESETEQPPDAVEMTRKEITVLEHEPRSTPDSGKAVVELAAVGAEAAQSL